MIIWLIYVVHAAWRLARSDLLFRGSRRVLDSQPVVWKVGRMKDIRIERKSSKGPKAIKGMALKFYTPLPSMPRSSWPSHVDLVTDPQTAAAVVQRFIANATTALPLLDPRNLISPFESHLDEIASLDAMYWNMVINGKLRSKELLGQSIGTTVNPLFACRLVRRGTNNSTQVSVRLVRIARGLRMKRLKAFGEAGEVA